MNSRHYWTSSPIERKLKYPAKCLLTLADFFDCLVFGSFTKVHIRRAISGCHWRLIFILAKITEMHSKHEKMREWCCPVYRVCQKKATRLFENSKRILNSLTSLILPFLNC